MDKETRPANRQGGNKGSGNNKHHRRKPFYIKKKNEGAESDAAPLNQAEKEVVKAGSNEADKTPSTAKANDGNSSAKGNGERNNRRDRHRNRRGRGDRRDRDIANQVENTTVNKPGIDAEEITYESNNNFESQADDIPEVIVSIEDEIVAVEDDSPKAHVSGVRFKPGGKIYYFDHGDLTIKNNSYVIVDTARGLEFGEVAFGDKLVKESSLVLPLRQVVRVATKDDIERNAANKEKETEAFAICLEKIQKHNLDMKLIEAQYSFDNSKLLFYFTSANRVDFRELVKDLASVFKTRIELRQIGIRDEAKIMGGLGACGRPLCCASFLSDFVQVSIKMAKEQNLSLNSGKISGCCGRLMCCLQYEYQTYREEGAKTPPVDSTVKTKDGVGVVTESNALAGTIKVRLKDKPDSPPALYKREDVTIISRANKKDEEEQ